MYSDELRAVRAIMKSIDPQTKVPARFLLTVQNLAKALDIWRVGSGDPTSYYQTMQAILERFPQVKEYLEEEYGDPSKSEINYTNNSSQKFEYYPTYGYEEWSGTRHDRGKSESHPLMTVENQNRQGGER